MIQIRSKVFETNSSSVHSLTVCTQSEMQHWKNGEMVYDWLEKSWYRPLPLLLKTLNVFGILRLSVTMLTAIALKILKKSAKCPMEKQSLFLAIMATTAKEEYP